MNKRKAPLAIFIISTLLLLAIMSGVAVAEDEFPKPKGLVNDFAGMLSPQVATELEQKLRSYEKQSGNEVAVVTVTDLQSTTIEDFAVRLFEKWKIGKKGKDNGVLLLIAKSERKVRIEVGYGLEPNLTDAQSYMIIREIISPAFKAGDYDRGVTEGAAAIIKATSGIGEGQRSESPGSPGVGSRNFNWRNYSTFAYFGLFLLFGFFQWLISILGRTKSWWLGGFLGAIVGFAVMAFSFTIGIIAIMALVPLGFIFDYVVSHAYAERKSHHQHGDSRSLQAIPWWAGGNWGPGGLGGGSRGGDFGGFGGGGSGGGGASGDW